MSNKIVVPDLGESVIEATITSWLKKEGETVKAGEAVVVLETDKVNLEVAAETSGVLQTIHHQEGEDVAVGAVLATLDEATQTAHDTPPKDEPEGQEASASPTVSDEAPEQEVEEQTVSADQMPHSQEKVSPVARRMAQEENIDLAKVEGSGAGGRVTKRDVEQFLTTKASPPTKPTPAVSQPLTTKTDREERIRMSRRRRTIATRLVEVQHTAAMLTTFNEIDMKAVMELRARHKETFKEKYGVSLGLSSFFVKAAIGALKEFPRLNAEIDNDTIVLKHYFDIGIAIGADEGLVVPVIREADRMSFAQIEIAIKEFVQQTQSNTLTLEDLRGGTFTITNGGVFGSMLSTPILNPPQVGILGLHKIEDRPIALNGEVVIHPMMYVALSYDHRIVDGREAVQFLVRLKALVEDPEALLLEG